MDIDITAFFNSANPVYYSASKMELGDDAGRITWENAVDRAGESTMLDTEEKREAFRAFIRSSGGWNDEEISAWSNDELEALLIQWISGDMRESWLHANMSDIEWIEYEEGCKEGIYPSRIYGGPLATEEFKNRVFFSLDF